MTTPATPAVVEPEPEPGWFGGLVLAVLGVGVLAVVVAQFDPGRLVHVQQVRGADKLTIAVAALILLVSVAFARRAPAQRQGGWVVGGVVAQFLVAAIMTVASPLITPRIDDTMDHDVAVVAVAPDRTFEVVRATRRDGSGDTMVLRARSRDGLLSWSARAPLARICRGADRVEVSFLGATEVWIRADDAFDGTLTVHRRTMEASKQISSCD